MWIFLLIVIVLLLPYIVMAICSTLIYCYETINTPCKELNSQHPTIPFGFCMFLRTMACAIVAVAWRPFGWLPRKKPSPFNPDSSLKHPPVVLIHGLYHNASAWMFLGGRLERAGYVVSPFSYSSFFTTFDEVVSRFNDHIHMLEVAFPGQKPILLGHSMGGLVIRTWLKDKANKQRAGGVITIGTPHRGSKLAALGPGCMSKNLLPGSGLLEELQKDKTPAPIPCVAFCSNADELVLPMENLLPPKGWKIHIVEHTSHFGLLLKKSLAHELVETLRRMGLPDQPGSVEQKQEGSPKHSDQNLVDNAEQGKQSGDPGQAELSHSPKKNILPEQPARDEKNAKSKSAGVVRKAAKSDKPALSSTADKAKKTDVLKNTRKAEAANPSENNPSKRKKSYPKPSKTEK